MKAFPTPTFSINDEARVTAVGGEGGMELRDYFAAKAMEGLLEHMDIMHEMTQQAVARRAYQMADAMMAARSKP
jgi:hypothetical protein